MGSPLLWGLWVTPGDWRSSNRFLRQVKISSTYPGKLPENMSKTSTCSYVHWGASRHEIPLNLYSTESNNSNLMNLTSSDVISCAPLNIYLSRRGGSSRMAQKVAYHGRGIWKMSASSHSRSLPIDYWLKLVLSEHIDWSCITMTEYPRSRLQYLVHERCGNQLEPHSVSAERSSPITANLFFNNMFVFKVMKMMFKRFI